MQLHQLLLVKVLQGHLKVAHLLLEVVPHHPQVALLLLELFCQHQFLSVLPGKTVVLQLNCNLPIHPIIVGVATRRFILHSYGIINVRLIVNNPSAVGISLHNGNIIAVGDDNETRAICFTCLTLLSVFFTGTVNTASTKGVSSGTEVQEQVVSIVKIQEAVTSDVEVQDVNDHGLNFLPECNNSCFVGKENIGCTHLRRSEQIKAVGDYVLFPSKMWHHGYCYEESNKHFITAQQFTKPTISEDTERFSRSFNVGQQDIITGQLGTTFREYAIVKDLGGVLLENWDTLYSAIDYNPQKMFRGMPIDCESNRQLPFEK
jgi:hypothetical protein